MNAQSTVAFRDLLIWLEQVRRPIILDGLTPDHRSTYDRLAGIYRPATDQDLERLLPTLAQGTCNFTEAGMCLYLAPNPTLEIRLPFLPFVQCNVGVPGNEARFYVGCGIRNRDPVDPYRFLGFRYEGPEGTGEGIHDFYHVQPVTSFRAGGPPLNPPHSDLDCLPTKQPSIPVDAVCPVTLCLALLVSLYGLPYLDEVASSGTVPIEFFERLHCWVQRPRYWRAVVGGTVYSVRTRGDDRERLSLILRNMLNAGAVKLDRALLGTFRATEVNRRIEVSDV